jgi:hypothetical protein
MPVPKVVLVSLSCGVGCVGDVRAGSRAIKLAAAGRNLCGPRDSDRGRIRIQSVAEKHSGRDARSLAADSKGESPTQDAILLVTWQDYPSISRVATPYLRLAGVCVEPKNHSRHDTPGG